MDPLAIPGALGLGEWVPTLTSASAPSKACLLGFVLPSCQRSSSLFPSFPWMEPRCSLPALRKLGRLIPPGSPTAPELHSHFGDTH